MDEEFLTTYAAKPSDAFWVCAVKGCRIPFPHEVGMTDDHRWKHVWADFYSAPPSTAD